MSFCRENVHPSPQPGSNVHHKIHRFVVLVCVFCTVNSHGEEPSTIEGTGWLLWDHPSWYIIPPMKQHAKKNISPHIPGIPIMILRIVSKLVDSFQAPEMLLKLHLFCHVPRCWFCFFMRHFAWWRQLMAWPSVTCLRITSSVQLHTYYGSDWCFMKEDGDCRKKTRAQWVKGQGASKLVFIFDILPTKTYIL